MIPNTYCPCIGMFSLRCSFNAKTFFLSLDYGGWKLTWLYSFACVSNLRGVSFCDGSEPTNTALFRVPISFQAHLKLFPYSHQQINLVNLSKSDFTPKTIYTPAFQFLS